MEPPPEGMLPVSASVQVIEGERFEVPEFHADRTEVTNAECARFVAVTGHVSDAEQIGDWVCYVIGALAAKCTPKQRKRRRGKDFGRSASGTSA